MADKIVASILYIRTVSKKKATIKKILAPGSLKNLLSDMTAKYQIELVYSGYKVK